jgi:hypothetical protein
MSDKAHCCYIDPATDKGCEIDADVELVAITKDPYDYTHSCFDHVGAMLGTNTDQEWGTYRIDVRPIGMDA